jgi:hypothetical protein
MSCPYCESPFDGSHFGDCRVSENKPPQKPRSEDEANAEAIELRDGFSDAVGEPKHG